MSSPKQRRIAPRVAIPADWSVTYRADDSRTGVWRDARLIDLSETGVAIEPLGLAADETLSGMLELHLVASSTDGEGLRLRGEIRHTTRSSLGRVRVGIHFVGLSANEQQLLDLLFGVS